MADTQSRPYARASALLACAIALAALFFFVAGVRQFAFHTDDAFISFRYARHLADGLGLVWNPGERVEGYTNFSWVVLMALGMRAGLEPEYLSWALGIASGVLVLVRLACFAARGRSLRDPWSWMAVLVLSLTGTFTAWCTGGLETMFFTLLVFLGYAALAERPTHPWQAALALALAALTRPEGLLFAGIGGAAMLYDLWQERPGGRAGLGALALLGSIVAAHLLWRHSYYGYWVPNTFYAKVPGTKWSEGLEYLGEFHGQYRLWWFLPLAVLAGFGERRRAVVLALAFLLPFLAYVVAVGGDHFEFRFLVHVFPCLYWLLLEGARVLWSGAPRLGLPRGACRLACAATIALLLVAAQQTFGGYSKDSPRTNGYDYYATRRSEEGRFLKRMIEGGILPRDVIVCLGGAGAVPYYTDWTVIDRLGLNDEFVAHMEETKSVGGIGHERYAPIPYLVQRGVIAIDIYNRFVHDELPASRPYPEAKLRLRYFPLEERFFVFGAIVSDEELARAFPGLEIQKLPG